ncbi:DUF4148 domain-containing protein [Streptococcus pyogenes]|uniref:DUF4148 domain-containing protein n=1 Tax=Streptococcus pyogenes TaxID=1314 RepID=UPI003DA06C30
MRGAAAVGLAQPSTHLKARTMKLHPRLLVIALFAVSTGYAGSARADDITVDPFPFVPSKSRAEVQAELQAFKRSGVDPWARNYDPLRHFQSSRTRAQVTAEFLRERDAVAAMNGEDSGSRYITELRHPAFPPVYLATEEAGSTAK